MSARDKKRKKTNRGGGFLIGSLSFIIICVALIFAMSVFFRVSEIEVEGASRYSYDEIVAASGIEKGDNLMLIQSGAVGQRIYDRLIFISSAQVARKLPNRVLIRVSESRTCAVVETDDGLWLVDNNCRLQGKCTTLEAAEYVSVIGLAGQKPKEGDTISVSQEDEPKKKYLEQILTTLLDRDILSKVDRIDVSNPANAQLGFDGRFTVKLGKNEYLENKLQLLLGAAEKLENTEKGTIDVSEDKKAYFSPLEEY